MSRVRKKKISTTGPSSFNKKHKTLDLGRTDHDDDDEHIHSDDDDEHMYNDMGGRKPDSDEDVEEEETLDAKKVRLARAYLRKLEAQDSDDASTSDSDAEDSVDDDEDDDNKIQDSSDKDYDRIGLKLQKERLKRDGTFHRDVAEKVRSSIQHIEESLSEETASAWIEAGHVKLLRGHDLTPTCVALHASGDLAISGSKDHSVLLWDVENQKKSLSLCPSWKQQRDTSISRTLGEVLAVACSDDGRYAAVGRRDATVSIFDIRAGKNSLVKTFEGHKDAVTCVQFRTKSLQLFSGSSDRCIRHYNLSEMMYLETLYGHQYGVTGIDCHRKERPVSIGRDRTARAWKLAEDTHLIFRGGAKVASADSISMVKDDWYVTGHEDGHLGLWLTEKKKAVTMIDNAHGAQGSVGRSIGSVECLKGSDLALTGSNDGYLRLWKMMTGSTLDSRGLEPLAKVPLEGYINGIAVGPKARFAVVAVGQEPRLGRWDRISGARNRFGIVSLRQTEDADDDDSEGGEQEAEEDIDYPPRASDSDDE